MYHKGRHLESTDVRTAKHGSPGRRVFMQSNQVPFGTASPAPFVEAWLKTITERPDLAEAQQVRMRDHYSGWHLHVYFQATDIGSHNMDYVPLESEWSDGFFAMEDIGEFTLWNDGGISFIGEDSFSIRLNLEQPVELVEFVEFYRNARMNVEKKAEQSCFPLSQVLRTISLPVWVDEGPPKLLPVWKEDSAVKVPLELETTVFAHLRGDVEMMVDKGLLAWPEFCRENMAALIPLLEPRGEDKGFRWKHGCMESTWRPKDGPGSIQNSFLEINPKVVSHFYFREYFGYSTEGYAALKATLGQAMNPSDIAQRLAAQTVEIPSDINVQVRQAIEFRATRQACKRYIDYVLEDRVPVNRMQETWAHILNFINKLRTSNPATE